MTDLKTRVDDDLYEAVKSLSEAEDTSLAEIQRRALAQYVETHDPVSPDGGNLDEPSDTLDAVLGLDLADCPHGISIGRDPKVDWTDKEVVSRTYRKRLLVLNAWLNDETEQDAIDAESVDEMLLSETHGFGLSKPASYQDKVRLQENGIAFPSPAIDPAWNRDDLLSRVIDLKKRETTNWKHGRPPQSLGDVMDETVRMNGEEMNVWKFDPEWYTSRAKYEASLRYFIASTKKVMGSVEADSLVHKIYQLVLEDYLDYLEEKGVLMEEATNTREWLEEHLAEEVTESAQSRMAELKDAESVD